MVKQRQLSNDEKTRIVKLYSKQLGPSKIAEKTNFKRDTIKSVIKKWKATGSVTNKPRKGRPRATSPREDRKIIQLATSDRRLTLHKLTKAIETDYDIDVSECTVNRRLHEANLKGRRARKKPLLTKKNIKKRLKWAREHEGWTSLDWAKILWSDESKFCIFGNNGSKFVWRKSGEALKPECILPTVKHGGGNKFRIFMQLSQFMTTCITL
jgi:transposase